MSIVRKLVRPKFKRSIKEYFTLYQSRTSMRKHLSSREIEYIIRECKKGSPTSKIAAEMKVSQRRIQQLYAEFRNTGNIHVPQSPGRWKTHPSEEQVEAVLAAHDAMRSGVTRTCKTLRNIGMDISYNTVYKVMKANGRVVTSEAKSRRRKWIRFERRYSNAMLHVDWHVMKDPRFRGYNLITYLDDASRCIVGAGVFKEATSENAVQVLRDAIARFGTPATILSDNGSCFVGRSGRRTPTKSWRPTVFEAELLDRGIELINSRPHHPQTNGKLERFHRTLEEELQHFDSLSEYIEFYNEKRLHWSLDIDNGEVPLLAFHNKKVPDAIRNSDTNWMERDIND